MEYTLTIEQTGGSGMLVPGRGFLLNNELTDFSAEYDAADPNRIQPGKRPRSSISPTIVLRDGKPFLALGSPGGSTIITTVTQLLVDRIDRQMSLPDAIADPRAQQANTPTVIAEQPFIDKYGPLLTPLRSQARPGRRPRHQQGRDRRSDGHRVRPRRPAHRGLRAHPPRRRLRPRRPPPLNDTLVSDLTVVEEVVSLRARRLETN